MFSRILRKVCRGHMTNCLRPYSNAATDEQQESNNATVSNATVSNATVSNATVSNATVSNATVSNATVSNATVSNATVSSAADQQQENSAAE
ncbi:hypothetical protein GJ744_007513 [Endocarpon pusillum]|uniref:Uncharacterized protein n=1 Tax=Endocarpon pusillum TaxID=364733 RepID=A0A8H7A7H7_9EURO|nr:hypothetical protein GJ744_007513 [Endocarpon pusillum]